MEIIYFGYDFYIGCLQMLLDMEGVRVRRVYAFPGDGVYESHRELAALAARHGVAVTEAPPEAEELAAFFRRGGDALAVCAGYGRRIPTERAPGFRGVNVHPSLLPEGRGPWPLPYVILRGCAQSGVTVHKLTPELDRGDILAQTAFPVAAAETLTSLSEKSRAAAPPLLACCLRELSRRWEAACPQGAGSYWPDRSDEDRVLLPDMTAEEADRRMRAFTGYGALARFPGGDILIREGHVRPDIIGAPGTLRDMGGGVRAAAVKDGSLWFRP